MTREEKIAAGVCVAVQADGVEEVLYVPTDKGLEFHQADAPYVLTSGGRNSGKSTMLRWDAHMRNLTIPGHKALLLRRTFPQLRNSHFGPAAIEAKKLQCPKDFNASHYYIDYANGSRLQFGHCESDAAILDYLSQEWDWIGFDELTTFTFDQFIRIAASARTTKATGRRAYVRAATNPIGVGASWVKRYFIDRQVDLEDNESYNAEDWINIAANMSDNEYADEVEYNKKLDMLPSDSLRRAYKDGEWLIEGQFFAEWAPRKTIKVAGDARAVEWHVIGELPRVKDREGTITPLFELPWIEITRAIDWGYSQMQPGWCGWFAHLPDGTAICFKEWVFSQRIPEEVAKTIVQKSEGMKIRYTVGDPVMWWERSGESIAETLRKHGVWMTEADNEREAGWVRLHSWLVLTHDDGTGIRPKLQFLSSGAPYAIRTVPSLQTDPKRPADLTQGEGVEDHAADGIRYWAMSRPNPSREPQKTLNHLPKEVREAIYGAEGGEVMGAESVRHR